MLLLLLVSAVGITKTVGGLGKLHSRYTDQSVWKANWSVYREWTVLMRNKKHVQEVWCVVKIWWKCPEVRAPLHLCNSSRQYFAKINCSICSYPFNQWIVRHWRTLIKSIFEDRGTRSTCRRSPRCPRHCTIALWRQSERTQTTSTTSQQTLRTRNKTNSEQICTHSSTQIPVSSS